MKRPICKACQRPADYVRTRNFATEDADVWECNTPGCANRGLIVEYTSTPRRCRNCAQHAELMFGLGAPELIMVCDHAPTAGQLADVLARVIPYAESRAEDMQEAGDESAENLALRRDAWLAVTAAKELLALCNRPNAAESASPRVS